jgi:predicted ester cyclase
MELMLKTNARKALEDVCSGRSLECASRYYSPTFEDHVNGKKYQGLDGVRQSVQFYTKIINNLRFEVKDQIDQGQTVVSRFIVEGEILGRHIAIDGMVMSRFERGLIVEDWAVSDSMGIVRQLGLWRSLMIAVLHWRTLTR